MEFTLGILCYFLNMKYEIKLAEGADPSRIIHEIQFYQKDSTSNDVLYLVLDKDSVPDASGFFIKTCEEFPARISRPNEIYVRSSEEVTVFFNSLLKIHSGFLKWRRRINELVNTSQDIRSMVRASIKYMNVRRLTVHDINYKILAEEGESEASTAQADPSSNYFSPEEIQDVYLRNPQYAKTFETRGLMKYSQKYSAERDYTVYYNNIFIKDVCAGRLICAVSNAKDCAGARTLISYLADAVTSAMVLKDERRHIIATDDDIHKIAKKLLSGKKPYADEMQSFFIATGWKASHKYHVIRFVPEDRFLSAQMTYYFLPRIEEAFSNCLAVLLDRNIYVLRNESAKGDEAEFFSRLPYFLRDLLLKAGISNGFNNIESCAKSKLQADNAFLLGSAADPMFWYYRFRDYSLSYIFRVCTDQLPSKDLCSKELFALMHYDETNPGADLFLTLKEFLNCNFNATHAAQNLYIHRTTFLYRMKRIEELTGLKLDDWNTKTSLFFSYSLLDYEK